MNMERPFTINMKSQQYSKHIRPLIEAGVAGYAIERMWNKTKHPRVKWSGTLFACRMTKTKDVGGNGFSHHQVSQKKINKKKTKLLASMLVFYKYLKK